MLVMVNLVDCMMLWGCWLTSLDYTLYVIVHWVEDWWGWRPYCLGVHNHGNWHTSMLMEFMIFHSVLCLFWVSQLFQHLCVETGFDSWTLWKKVRRHDIFLIVGNLQNHHSHWEVSMSDYWNLIQMPNFVILIEVFLIWEKTNFPASWCFDLFRKHLVFYQLFLWLSIKSYIFWWY